VGFIDKLDKAIAEAEEDERAPEDEVSITLTVAELTEGRGMVHYHKMESLSPEIEPHPNS
jgi:hypothetical protein